MFIKITLLLSASLLTLILGELVLRLPLFTGETMQVQAASLGLSSDPELGYEPLKNFSDEEKQHNSHGMRSPEVALEKPEDVFRIACIGDSITYGWEIGQGEDFPACLQRLIQAEQTQTKERVEVLNFGVPAYNISQVRRSLEARVMAFQPDLLLYGYCLNDTQKFNLISQALLAQLPANQRAILVAQGGAFAFQEPSFFESSRLLMRVRHLINKKSILPSSEAALYEASKKDPQLALASKARYFYELYEQPESLTLLSSELTAMRQIAGDIPTFLVLFPLLDSLENYPLKTVHAAISGTAASTGFEVFDPLPAFVEFEAVNTASLRHDFLHLTAAGSECCARFLLTELTERGLLPQ